MGTCLRHYMHLGWALCLVKVARMLCRPVSLGSGTQQGCPSSAIEALLVLLHGKVQGGVGLEIGFKAPIVVSAYADDVPVLGYLPVLGTLPE